MPPKYIVNRALLGGLVVSTMLLGLGTSASATPAFIVTNLVTNNQAANPAKLTDGQLRNAWGLTASGGSPFWVGDNAAGVSTVYNVNPITNAVIKGAQAPAIPGDGSVTGVVFGGVAGAFNADNFLFVSEDGTISGWRGALGNAGPAETLQAGSAANVYKGVAFATVTINLVSHSYLYAANFRTGAIDVVKGDGLAPTLAGNFLDPTIPKGYAPFDIKLLNGILFVTYALQDGAAHDDVAGLGNGFVSKFDLQGNFLGRIASNGTLDSPWGLAIAPSSFGGLAGDLLVGNFGDGTIDAYDLSTNSFVTKLLTSNGAPLFIDGLWAISVGNGGSAGSNQALYFTAGPNDEANGLFGVIMPAPEPMTLSLFGAGLAGAALVRRRRNRKV